MERWSVELDTELVTKSGVHIEDVVDSLVDELHENGVAVSFRDSRSSIRLFVVSNLPEDAIASATELVRVAAEEAGAHINSIYGVSAKTEAALDLDLSEVRVPNVLGVAELAELLGITKQRVSELARQKTFPTPLMTLASGPIWVEPTILKFIETWVRRPGRPGRAHPSPTVN